jgi:hypothetical protein
MPRATVGALCLAAIACPFVAGCDPGNLNGFNPGAITIEQSTCGGLRASDFFWALNGFEHADILNPDERNQSQLTVVVHVGQRRVLNVSAGSVATSEDCASKATSVEWIVSNAAVARVEVGATSRSATLVALQPGDVSVSAILGFQDGTSPIQALPYAFATFGGAPVTVVRVVP